MKTKITKEQLQAMSHEELMDSTKNCAVDFHLLDGHFTQLCVNDLQGYDNMRSLFYTKTGIKIKFQDVDFIEVIK